MMKESSGNCKAMHQRKIKQRSKIHPCMRMINYLLSHEFERAKIFRSPFENFTEKLNNKRSKFAQQNTE